MATFLDCLFWAASNETSSCPDEQISSMYQELEELKNSEAILCKLLTDAGLTGEAQNRVLPCWRHFHGEYERQGFVNGVRLGLTLAGELREW